MIQRLQRMIARESADLHPGSLTAYKSRTLVEELTRRTDSKVEAQFIVWIYSYFSNKICAQERSRRPGAGKHAKQQGEKSPRRPGLVDVTNHLQVKNVKTVEMKTGRPELSKPFTNEQDKQIAAFFGQHPCFYDMSHPDYKAKKKRNALIHQFAQSMFTSGKCVLSFIFNVALIFFFFFFF